MKSSIMVNIVFHTVTTEEGILIHNQQKTVGHLQGGIFFKKMEIQVLYINSGKYYLNICFREKKRLSEKSALKRQNQFYLSKSVYHRSLASCMSILDMVINPEI